MANSTWIIVANSSFAKILAAKNNNELHEIHQMSHPESRLLTSELVSDRQGRGHESVGTRRSPMEPTTMPKEVEFANFAKDVSTYLDTAFGEGKFSKLYIAAGPHFLGLLREKLSATIINKIAVTIDKDLTQFGPKEIRTHLPDIL